MRYRNLLALPLIAWLYAPLFPRLLARWMYDPSLSHGIFVPAFALLVLWRERNKLKAIEAAPSLAGLPLVGLALFMRNPATLNGELFFSGVSLLLLLAGLIILFYGWEFFRAVLFPWAFLILVMPVPSMVLRKVTFSLWVPTVKLATLLLQLVGVPSVRQGSFITFPLANFVIDSAATESSVPSLMAPLALTIMHGYWADNRKWVRAVLACSSVPIAIVADSLWMVGTVLLRQFFDPEEATRFSHYAGWVIFALSLVMVFIVQRLIRLIWGGSLDAESLVRPPTTITSTLDSRYLT